MTEQKVVIYLNDSNIAHVADKQAASLWVNENIDALETGLSFHQFYDYQRSHEDFLSLLITTDPFTPRSMREMELVANHARKGTPYYDIVSRDNYVKVEDGWQAQQSWRGGPDNWRASVLARNGLLAVYDGHNVVAEINDPYDDKKISPLFAASPKLLKAAEEAIDLLTATFTTPSTGQVEATMEPEAARVHSLLQDAVAKAKP